LAEQAGQRRMACFWVMQTAEPLLARQGGQVSLSDVVTLVAAAFGAFFGSWLAFLLENRRRRRAEADRRYSCLMQAQLALGMQQEKLLNIQRGYLDPHRNESDWHRRLEPLHMSMTDLRVDFSALVFMAEGDDGFSILQSIYLAEQGA